MSYYYTINNIQNIYHHISFIDFFQPLWKYHIFWGEK